MCTARVSLEAFAACMVSVIHREAQSCRISGDENFRKVGAARGAADRDVLFVLALAHAGATFWDARGGRHDCWAVALPTAQL